MVQEGHSPSRDRKSIVAQVKHMNLGIAFLIYTYAIVGGGGGDLITCALVYNTGKVYYTA